MLLDLRIGKGTRIFNLSPHIQSTLLHDTLYLFQIFYFSCLSFLAFSFFHILWILYKDKFKIAGAKWISTAPTLLNHLSWRTGVCLSQTYKKTSLFNETYECPKGHTPLPLVSQSSNNMPLLLLVFFNLGLWNKPKKKNKNLKQWTLTYSCNLIHLRHKIYQQSPHDSNIR